MVGPREDAAVFAGIAEGEGTDSAAVPSDNAGVSSGVTAGSGVLSACISTICSAGAAQPESSISKAMVKEKMVFMANPF